MEGHNISASKYQELEKLIPANVQKVRKILQAKYDITVPDQCDDFVVRCLRLKDGNVDKAIQLIKTFYGAIEDLKKWNVTMVPSMHSDFYKVGPHISLLKRDASGRRIFVVRVKLWDPKVTSCDQAIACTWMMSQYITSSYVDTQREGYVSVWDCSEFTMEQAWAVNHWNLLMAAKWMQNGIAGRCKGLHVINQPRIVNLIYAAVKPFLKEKFKKRIHFHGNVDSLLKHVPANSLPTYLGGTQDPESCVDREFMNSMIKQDEYFQDMIKYRLPVK